MFKFLKYILIVDLCALMLGIIPMTASAADLLRIGSRGKAVIEVQGYLYRLHYMRRRPDGYYGRMTAEAVKSFQLEQSLTPDGIVGIITWTALKESINTKKQVIEHTVAPGETLAEIAERYNSSITAIMIKNKLSGNEVKEGQVLIIPTGLDVTRISSRGRIGGVQVIPWSIVNQLWERGENATVIDVETGQSFRVRRLYGIYHADIEPLTKEDTEIMKTIYGGKWSWSRRSVVVQLRNLHIAASINGMPHGGQSIFDNDFNGQFCAHFLGSRVHQNGKVDPDHLAMIKKAGNVNLGILITGSYQKGITPIQTVNSIRTYNLPINKKY